MTNLPMHGSVPVPANVRHARPDTSLQRIGPPPGWSENDCKSVEALVGLFNDIPGVADYFKPDAEQLAALNAGGVIEFVQFSPRMTMHAVNVWPADS